MIRKLALTSSAMLALALLASHADARGRIGSMRMGGYNSHGKGSHYIGGHSSLDAPKVHVATMCNDGSYSSSSGRGTCSHHGGEGGG